MHQIGATITCEIIPTINIVDLKQDFYRCHRIVQNDEHVYMELKSQKQERTKRVEPSSMKDY
jgi:hypothetical protein